MHQVAQQARAAVVHPQHEQAAFLTARSHGRFQGLAVMLTPYAENLCVERFLGADELIGDGPGMNFGMQLKSQPLHCHHRPFLGLQHPDLDPSETLRVAHFQFFDEPQKRSGSAIEVACKFVR